MSHLTKEFKKQLLLAKFLTVPNCLKVNIIPQNENISFKTSNFQNYIATLTHETQSIEWIQIRIPDNGLTHKTSWSALTHLRTACGKNDRIQC